MKTIEWTLRAEAELHAIGAFIARDKPMAAARWLEKIIDRVEAAAFMPGTGHVVPEFDREDLREVHVKRYRIVYRVRPRSIQVLTVFEGHKLLNLPFDEAEEDNE